MSVSYPDSLLHPFLSLPGTGHQLERPVCYGKAGFGKGNVCYKDVC